MYANNLAYNHVWYIYFMKFGQLIKFMMMSFKVDLLSEKWKSNSICFITY